MKITIATPVKLLREGNAEKLAEYGQFGDQLMPVLEAEELKKEQEEWQKEAEKTRYASERRREYPKLEDQLDALWKWFSGDLQPAEDMAKQIAEIKKKYPRPEDESVIKSTLKQEK
jgi:hypothetical protein